MKKGIIILVCLIALFLFTFGSEIELVFSSGNSTNQTINITLGNTLPYVLYANVSPGQGDIIPVESGTRTVDFVFNMTDADGTGNLNSSTAELNITFFSSGAVLEESRWNDSCVQQASYSDPAPQGTLEFNCKVTFYWYDTAGISWRINASIADINNERGYTNYSGPNNFTMLNFSYYQLSSMVMSPNALDFGTVSSPDSNINATSPITVNHTGNAMNQMLNLTPYHLIGESNGEEIPIENGGLRVKANVPLSGRPFDICTDNAGNVLNATTQELPDGIINPYDSEDDNWQRNIYFCLSDVPGGLTAQDFTSAAYGAWTIEMWPNITGQLP